MFFTYRQNNSGGRWKPPAHIVIIEADEVRFANLIAEDHGIYFDGCDQEIDCSCCGDRWSTPYESGTPEPMYYDEKISEMEKLPVPSKLETGQIDSVLIVYKNKSTENFGIKTY